MSDVSNRGEGVMLASGVMWYPDDPRVEDVRGADFEAQSGIGRWGGHARCPDRRITYTLAEHGYRVARLLVMWGAPRDACLGGLCHDTHEVYPPGDVPGSRLRGDSPRAKALREEESRAAAVLRDALGMPADLGAHGALIHRADMVLLATERRDLMPAGHDEHFAGLPDPLPHRIAVMSPVRAWRLWCETFDALGGRWPA